MGERDIRAYRGTIRTWGVIIAAVCEEIRPLGVIVKTRYWSWELAHDTVNGGFFTGVRECFAVSLWKRVVERVN